MTFSLKIGTAFFLIITKSKDKHEAFAHVKTIAEKSKSGEF